MDLGPRTGRYLSFGEREEIGLLRVQGWGVRSIARQIGRSPSTVSRELRRNAATRGGKLEYRASVAQWKAELVAQRPKTPKLVENPRLREYVQDRLSGVVRGVDGEVAGPAPSAWIGRNKPRRGDRRWVRGWSPEQISHRLRVDFPDDNSMRISHEAIYQALYIESRGALKRDLVLCLCTGRALRVPRARARSKAWAHVTPEVMIDKRPGEACGRDEPGRWEGDLVIGKANASAVATLVERTSRHTLVAPLPDGYDASNTASALAAALARQPAHLLKTLTSDLGGEMARWANIEQNTGIKVYFCEPRSPWQRPTNGLLRRWLPKGTDLNIGAVRLAVIADHLNTMPRKLHHWNSAQTVYTDLCRNHH